MSKCVLLVVWALTVYLKVTVGLKISFNGSTMLTYVHSDEKKKPMYIREKFSKPVSQMQALPDFFI